MTSAEQDIDAIATALAQLRSARGGPRGFGDRAGGEFGRGVHHPRHGHPGARGEAHDHHDEGDDRDRHPHRGRGEHSGRHGAGPARMRMLEALVVADEPMSINAIAELVGVDQPRASRLVQQAEMMGLVVREVDPDDARRMRVRLSAEGRAIATSRRRDRHDRIRVAMAQFSGQERAEFARLFAKFADAWADRDA